MTLATPSKPVLPSLNLPKTKQGEDQGDVGLAQNSSQLSSRQSAKGFKSSFLQNAQQFLGSYFNISSSSSGNETRTQPSDSTGVNKQLKPVVPQLHLGRTDGLGFGGIEGAASARLPLSGTLPQVQRVPLSSRPALVQSPDELHQQENTAKPETPWESGAITPAQALKRYSEFLTNYEQSEILEYPQVYFVGRCGAPKVNGNPHLAKGNCGYDDDRGDYVAVMHDHLAYRYEILSVLGKGSFGQVLKCHDFKTNTLKAVKIIRNKKRFHHQALVELKVLQYLTQHDQDDQYNVIHMKDHFYFRNHLCITFELLSLNLYEFIKQNNFVGLSLGLIRRFSSQILVSLKYLKSLNIIHCDLKPENILLKHSNRSLVKVIDFGSSCMVDEKVYTYIQSRFYRSPEVILGLSYGPDIDMWSFGCILAELYTGYPLFPGEDEHEQLLCIMETLGPPSRALLEKATRRKLFFDSSFQPRIQANSQGRIRMPGTKTLQTALKCTDIAFLDLLERCLQWDPAQRITPEQALQHAWVTDQSPSPTYRPYMKTPRIADTPQTNRQPSAASLKSIVRQDVPITDTAMGHVNGAAVPTWMALGNPIPPVRGSQRHTSEVSGPVEQTPRSGYSLSMTGHPDSVPAGQSSARHTAKVNTGDLAAMRKALPQMPAAGDVRPVGSQSQPPATHAEVPSSKPGTAGGKVRTEDSEGGVRPAEGFVKGPAIQTPSAPSGAMAALERFLPALSRK